MRLRFARDRRTLFWAFVLLPSAPALAYAVPAATPWLTPWILYLSYCSGVLSHNHNHCRVFSGRRSNALYAAWLSLFYGFPIFAWIPTHNQNHHRYLNGDGDATRTTKHTARNTLIAALTYPLASGLWQSRGVAAYAWEARKHPARLRRVLLETAALLGGHGLLLALALGMHGALLGAFVYGISVGMPALLATYFMMFTNYLQHVDCDPQSPDNHSRNFTSPSWNWFVFDNGLHTVHHDHRGVHWSRYRALHEARAARIAPHLNQNSLLGYVIDTYVLRRGGITRGDGRTVDDARNLRTESQA